MCSRSEQSSSISSWLGTKECIIWATQNTGVILMRTSYIPDWLNGCIPLMNRWAWLVGLGVSWGTGTDTRERSGSKGTPCCKRNSPEPEEQPPHPRKTPASAADHTYRHQEIFRQNNNPVHVITFYTAFFKGLGSERLKTIFYWKIISCLCFWKKSPRLYLFDKKIQIFIFNIISFKIAVLYLNTFKTVINFCDQI